MPFSRGEASNDRPIYLLLEGPSGTRKTTLGLQAPGPLGVLDLNRGLGIPEFNTAAAAKEIQVSPIPMPHATTSEARAVAARASWAMFYHDVTHSLRTYPYTLVDTGSNAWEICRLSEMGGATVNDLDAKAKKRRHFNFDQPNAAFRDWIYLPFEEQSNLIVTTHQGEFDGEIYTRGFRELPEVALQHVVLNKQFQARIVKCRSNQAAVGRTLECPSFADLACVFYPDSDEEDWGSNGG